MRYSEVKKDLENIEKNIGKKNPQDINNELRQVYIELCMLRNSFIINVRDPLYIKLQSIRKQIGR
jgi:hypothetical protein